jgi:predicted DNA-binding transcriptional regulator AlpA
MRKLVLGWMSEHNLHYLKHNQLINYFNEIKKDLISFRELLKIMDCNEGTVVRWIKSLNFPENIKCPSSNKNYFYKADVYEWAENVLKEKKLKKYYALKDSANNIIKNLSILQE